MSGSRQSNPSLEIYKKINMNGFHWLKTFPSPLSGKTKQAVALHLRTFHATSSTAEASFQWSEMALVCCGYTLLILPSFFLITLEKCWKREWRSHTEEPDPKYIQGSSTTSAHSGTRQTAVSCQDLHSDAFTSHRDITDLPFRSGALSLGWGEGISSFPFPSILPCFSWWGANETTDWQNQTAETLYACYLKCDLNDLNELDNIWKWGVGGGGYIMTYAEKCSRGKKSRKPLI